MFKIYINIFILVILFSGCLRNSDCYSSYNVHYVDWGNGTGMQPVFTPNYSSKLCK
ncbi:hypothetical protein [Aliarcobacter vitoriensis]|uniref:hypothetical protein n=1 Tax=Aliarcobacter vitoriensis TaxID=2011099 RepID=UPI001C9CC320|nr:hypothetical protein [Aliarcobacter vitoriensis]